MELLIYRHLWGITEAWETLFPRIKDLSYSGIEHILPDEGDRERFRCIHIHARVGYEEGPQVPDPRAPEYERHVLAHERWWTQVWDAQEKRGLAESTLTPEFGAPDYLHTLPYSRMPVADLWDICNWQAERQRSRFSSRSKRV